MKYIFTLLLSLLLFSVKAQYTPETAVKINCENILNPLALQGITAVNGPNYDCLTTLDNTAWCYFTMCDSGSVEIDLNAQSSNNTMGLVLYGPIYDTLNIRTQLQTAPIATCLPYGPHLNPNSEIMMNCSKGIYYLIVSYPPNITSLTSWFTPMIIGYGPGQHTQSCNTFCNVCNTITSSYQQLCTIDLDAATQRNKLVWEKGDLTNISGYVIYRENNINLQFDSLDFVPVTSLSEYIDMTAVPASRAWRYKITAYDDCGNMPDITYPITYNIFTSIFLQQGVGTINSINLNWSGPTSQIFPGTYGWIPSFYIYRGSSMNNMQLIDSVPITMYGYTDVNPLPGLNYYQIEMRKSAPCVSSILPTYTRSGSNFIGTLFTGIADLNPSLRFSIQPNPAKEYFKVVLSNEAQQLENTISIITIDGKKVAEFSNVQHNQEILTGTFASGAYIAELSNMKGISRKNLIIQ